MRIRCWVSSGVPRFGVRQMGEWFMGALGLGRLDGVECGVARHEPQHSFPHLLSPVAPSSMTKTASKMRGMAREVRISGDLKRDGHSEARKERSDPFTHRRTMGLRGTGLYTMQTLGTGRWC